LIIFSIRKKLMLKIMYKSEIQLIEKNKKIKRGA